MAQERVRKPWWKAVPAKRMLAPNLADQEGLGKGLSRTVPQVRYAKTRSATAASPALRGYQGRGSGFGSKTGAFLPPTRLKSNDHSALSQPDPLLAAANGIRGALAEGELRGDGGEARRTRPARFARGQKMPDFADNENLGSKNGGFLRFRKR